MISDYIKIFQSGSEVTAIENTFFLQKQPFYFQSIKEFKSSSVAISNSETFNLFILQNRIQECWTQDGWGMAQSPFSPVLFKNEDVRIYDNEQGRDSFAALFGGQEAVSFFRTKSSETPDISVAINVGRNYFLSHHNTCCAVFSIYFDGQDIPLSQISEVTLHLTYFGVYEELSISDKYKLCFNKNKIECFSIIFLD